MMKRRFKRQLQSLEAVFAYLETFLQQHRLKPQLLPVISLAVEEIFTNCVKYNPSGVGNILIQLTLKKRSLEIRITDPDAPPFDITRAPAADTAAPLSQRESGRLGLHLVRQMMDTVQYEYRDGQSIITLQKALEPNHV